MNRILLLTIILAASTAFATGDKITYGGKSRLADPYSCQLPDGTTLTFSQRHIHALYASVKPQLQDGFYYKSTPGDEILDRGSIYVTDEEHKIADIIRLKLNRDHGVSIWCPPPIRVTSETRGVNALIEHAKGFDRHSIGLVDFQGTVSAHEGNRIYLTGIEYSTVNLDCPAFDKAAKEYWTHNENLIERTFKSNTDIKKLLTGNGAIKTSDIFSKMRLKMEDPLNDHRFFDVKYCAQSDMIELDAPSAASRLWYEDVEGTIWVYSVELYFLFKRDPMEIQEVTLRLNKGRSGTRAAATIPARR